MTNKFLVSVLIFTIVALSIWQAQYTITPLEYGLMLSNAKDLVEGLKPYKNIFIQYGFLTTLVHGAAYKLISENIAAIMGVTAIAYGIGIYVIYKITLLLGIDRKTSLLIILIYGLFHPIVIYPWANYIAFPLIMLGLKYSLDAKDLLTRHLISGVYFGLAILAREGLAPALITYLMISNLFSYLSHRNFHAHLKYFSASVCGISTALLPFVVYLQYADIFDFWKQSAFDIPRIYAEVMFPHMRGFNVWRPWSLFPMLEVLWKQIVLGITEFEPRWVIFLVSILLNVFILLLGVFNKKYRHERQMSIKIALLSLLLLSSTLHLAELFRVATGALIGILNIFVYIRAKKYQYAVGIAGAICLLPGAFPKNGGQNFSTTNYFFPTAEKRANVEAVERPAYFKGQLWPKSVINYYVTIETDLKFIKKVCPFITHHHNNTHDAFLHVLSPFLKYQMAPFWFFSKMNELRNEFDLKSKLDEQTILLFRSQIVPDGLNEFKAPQGYSEFKTYIDPTTREPMTIMLPTRCLAAQSAAEKIL